MPTMQIKNRGQDIFHFRYGFYPTNYDPHPALKMRLPSERAHNSSHPGGDWIQQCTGRYDAFGDDIDLCTCADFTALPSSAPRPCRLCHGSSRKLVGGEHTRGMYCRSATLRTSSVNTIFTLSTFSGHPGSQAAEIRQAASHVQALAQCAVYLQKM